MDIKKNFDFNKVIVLLLLVIAMTFSLGVNFFQGNEVTLELDGEIIEMVTFQVTVGDFITQEGIRVKEGASIEPSLDTIIDKNLKITIINPKNYTILHRETELPLVSLNTRVSDILTDANIQLGPMDYTIPSVETIVEPNAEIQVFKVKELSRVEESAIPFEKEVVNNHRIDKGVVNTLQEGKDGLRRSHIRDIYINGVLSSSVIVSDTILEEPLPQVTEKGTNNVLSTSRGDTRFKEAMVLEATAYDLSYASTGKRPGDKYWGITASGTRARPGTVAVDPRVIPLGTKLYVESLDGTKDYGFAIAEDVGGAIKGMRIDLFFNTATEVRNFGRRDVKVYILE